MVFVAAISIAQVECDIVKLISIYRHLAGLCHSDWAVMAARLVVAATLWFSNQDILLLAVLAGQRLLMLWKYRFDLRRRPEIKPGLIQRLFRR